MSHQMKETLLKIVIVGFPFGFSLMWFTYWIVKIYKGKQKALQQRKEGSADGATSPTET